MKIRRALSLLLLVLVGCSSTPSTNPESSEVKPSLPSGRDYGDVVNAWSRRAEDYANLAASFRVTAVILSRELTEEQVRLDAKRFNWSQEETETARQKALYDLSTQTTVLVSLYTSRDEDNNLDKSHPAWNVYLDVHGKRIVPQEVKRLYENRASLSQKYPGIDVWSRNYYLKFPVAVDDTTSGGAELVLSGPVGTAHLKY